MSKTVQPKNSQNNSIEELLEDIDNVSSFMRFALTLYEVDDVRIDMQGITTSGYYNLQIQIG